ncbi:MAG: LysR substrate-binding domain-containing protein [Myxococcota bacterium]
MLDIVEGAYDLVIRSAPLKDSTMICRKLASDRRLLVASTGYLERYGQPRAVLSAIDRLGRQSDPLGEA